MDLLKYNNFHCKCQIRIPKLKIVMFIDASPKLLLHGCPNKTLLISNDNFVVLYMLLLCLSLSTTSTATSPSFSAGGGGAEIDPSSTTSPGLGRWAILSPSPLFAGECLIVALPVLPPAGS